MRDDQWNTPTRKVKRALAIVGLGLTCLPFLPLIVLELAVAAVKVVAIAAENLAEVGDDLDDWLNRTRLATWATGHFDTAGHWLVAWSRR